MSDVFDIRSVPRNPRILLIKIRSIGDVVYNTTVYAPLKRLFPGSHLTVVAEPPSDELVCGHPDVDEVLRFRRGLVESARFYLDLLGRRFDVAIDMHEGPRGAWMCFFSRAPLRIGNADARRAFLYNVRLSLKEYAPRYPVEYQIALVRKMGAAVESGEPAIHLTSETRERADRLLREHGIASGDAFCVIHPGTKRVWDQWQYDKFAKVAVDAAGRRGLKILLTTGPGQEDQAEAVRRHLGGLPHAYFIARLGELAAIVEKARFALCHNGGFMHLAAAMRTPVIALFGPVSPRVWKPMGAGHAVMYSGIECSPCTKDTRRAECYNGDAECKQRISAEDVIREIDRILTS